MLELGCALAVRYALNGVHCPGAVNRPDLQAPEPSLGWGSGCSSGCSSLPCTTGRAGTDAQVRTPPDSHEPPSSGLIIRVSPTPRQGTDIDAVFEDAEEVTGLVTKLVTIRSERS